MEKINPNIASYPSPAPALCTHCGEPRCKKHFSLWCWRSQMGAQMGRVCSHFCCRLYLSPHHRAPLSLRRLTGNEPLTILPLTSEMEEAAVKAHYKVCDRLKLEKKQRRMCRRDPGVAETLMEAISMSALECQYQFRFERWNCTLEGRYRASLLKRGEWDRGLVGLAGTSCTKYFPLWCLLVHPVPLVGGHLPRGPTKVCRR